MHCGRDRLLEAMAGGDPRTVLLFGKTGDGKSTVANMLLTGDVEGEFQAGNSMAAITQQTTARTNNENKWTIIDTVGLFSTDKPEEDLYRSKELLNDLARSHPEIHNFCYIKKATKFTRADEECWKVFQELFGEYYENIVLVFTSCKKGWLEENKGLIEEVMGLGRDQKGYQKVAVEFPPHDDDPAAESIRRKKRKDSLELLQTALSTLEAGPVLLPQSPHRSIIRNAVGQALKYFNPERSVCHVDGGQAALQDRQGLLAYDGPSDPSRLHGSHGRGQPPCRNCGHQE